MTLPLAGSLPCYPRYVAAPASEDKTARIWEVPPTPLPIPSWLAELAEAVAGGRFDDRGNLQAVPLSALLEIKSNVRISSVTNVYIRWAQWFFGDRSTRNVSSTSTVTMAEWVQQRIEDNTAESRQEVESYRPFHSLTNDGRSRLILAQEKTARQMIQADAESRRAVESAPNDSEAWRARAEILDRNGNVVSALAALDRSIDLQPENPVFWTAKGAMLEKKQSI